MKGLERYLYDPETPYTNFEAHKLFDHLDFIFIDGDANILPWFQRAEKIVTLIRMCKRTNKIMFAAACGMQIFMYVYSFSQRIKRVVNGNGKGGSISDAQLLSREVLAKLRPGEVLLDNSTGDVYQYDPSVHEFYPIGNVGLHYHKAAEDNHVVREAMLSSVCSPPKAVNDPYPLYTGKLTETICRVSKEYVQHWVVKDLETREFLVSQLNAWDVHPVNLTCKDAPVSILASSVRGPMIVAYANTIGVQFHISTKYPATLTMLRSFITYHMTRYQNDSDRFDKRLDELTYEYGPPPSAVGLHRSRRKSSVTPAELEIAYQQPAGGRPFTSTTQASSNRPMTAGSLAILGVQGQGMIQAFAKVLYPDNSRPKSAVRNSGFTFSKRFHEPFLVENNATTHSPILLDASKLPPSGIFKTNTPNALLKPTKLSDLAIRGDFDKNRSVELLKKMVGIRSAMESAAARKPSDAVSSYDETVSDSDPMLATYEFQSSSFCDQKTNPQSWKTQMEIRELLHPGYPTNKMPKQGPRIFKSQSISHISTKPPIRINIPRLPFTSYQKGRLPTAFPSRDSLGPTIANDGTLYEDPETKQRRIEMAGRQKWISDKNFVAFGKVQKDGKPEEADMTGKPPWQHEYRKTEKKRWVAGNFKT